MVAAGVYGVERRVWGRGVHQGVWNREPCCNVDSSSASGRPPLRPIDSSPAITGQRGGADPSSHALPRPTVPPHPTVSHSTLQETHTSWHGSSMAVAHMGERRGPN